MTSRSSIFLPRFLGAALVVGLFLLTSACDSGGGSNSVPTFTVEGSIVNTTDRGVRNAQVQFRQDDAVEAETATDDSGEYMVTVPEGEYDVRVLASGYTQLDYTTTVTSSSTADPRQLLGGANVSGTILDAQTGEGIEEAEVAFAFADGGNSQVTTYSSHADTSRANADLITTTGADGVYGILQAPTGAFVCVVRAPGYVTEVIDVAFQEGPNEFAPTTTTEALTEGQLRIVLGWGESPTDLDSHLTGPDDGDGRFHLYYANQTPSGSNAELDRDDTSSFGPETVTVDAFRAGTYRYSVHNFSDGSENGALGIEQSPAQVKVYDESGLIRTYNPPAATATSGNTWRVFELDGSTLAISDDNQNTLGYYTANGSSDVTTFVRTGDVDGPKPAWSPFPFYVGL